MCLCLSRFWRGLYNRFDRGMHPRQSVEEHLSTIQEETRQLEEQLASHKQVEEDSLTPFSSPVRTKENALSSISCFVLSPENS